MVINSGTTSPLFLRDANRRIRLLIVDDSPLIRTILTAMLADVPDIQIVGQATDGQEAVQMTLRLQPDIITMDIRMPQMDGLEATRRILSVRPTPIIVVASSVYSTDYNIAFNALEAGALTVIEKPKGLLSQDYENVREQLVTAVRTLAGVTVIPRRESKLATSRVGPMTAMLQAMFDRPIQLIAIGASTGGPAVLKEILQELPKDFAIPIVIVQHVLAAFVPGLADWLGHNIRLPVSVGYDGEQLRPGKVVIAPGNCHLIVTPGGVLRMEYSPPIEGQRPSATRLFQSVARVFGSDVVGIILTGMGEDGADGLVELSKAGAHIIAQNQASCTVYGMPKAAVDRGVVHEVLAPDGIVTRLLKLNQHVQSISFRR